MAVVSMKQLLEAGVHFGHQTRRWNPKMAPYIYMERNGIYIIDLQKTVKKLEEAYNFVRSIGENGQSILFVGTKKQAQDSVREEAERVGMFFVNARSAACSRTSKRCARVSTVWPSCAKCRRTVLLTSCLKRKSSNLRTKSISLKNISAVSRT